MISEQYARSVRKCNDCNVDSISSPEINSELVESKFSDIRSKLLAALVMHFTIFQSTSMVVFILSRKIFFLWKPKVRDSIKGRQSNISKDGLWNYIKIILLRLLWESVLSWWARAHNIRMQEFDERSSKFAISDPIISFIWNFYIQFH